MFVQIFHDILRGSTTTICLITLFFVLARPKLKPKAYAVFTAVVTVIDALVCSIFYTRKDYTGVVYYSLSFYIVFVIILKFMFYDKTMQWLFICVTVLNVYSIIVMASYFLCGFFPNPYYAVTAIRIVMFAAIIFLFYKYLRPLYLEVSENWGAFLLPTTGILANYIYMLLSLGDVESSMRYNVVYFSILTVVTILTYLAIIFSLRSLKQKFALREENLKRKANEELLTREIECFGEYINNAKQNRHDLRHHNLILMDYLSHNDTEGAKSYLEEYNQSIICNSMAEFSKHPTVNAVLRIIGGRAADSGIEFGVRIDEDNISLSATDTGIILSNLLENALEACQKSGLADKHIHYWAICENGNLLIEIRNSVSGTVTFTNGIPNTTKEGGGTGVASVLAIVNKYQGMLNFKQEGTEFFTRLVIPITQTN